MLKRMVVAIIALSVVLAPASSASKSETADDIIRKCVEAMGGEKNWLFRNCRKNHNIL